MLAYLFVVVAVAFRFLLVSHSAWLSFTPVGAALLFFGARMSRKQAWVPLALLAGSDVVLTKLVYGSVFTTVHLATWAWYAGILLLGGGLRHNAKAARVAGAALVTSVSFFLVSNFAVWAVWDMYPKTLAGLMTCYAAAIPFFRNTVVSDLLFSAVMFGIAAMVDAYTRAHQRVTA